MSVQNPIWILYGLFVFASARKAENEKRTEPTRIRLSIEGVQKRYKKKRKKNKTAENTLYNNKNAI